MTTLVGRVERLKVSEALGTLFVQHGARTDILLLWGGLSSISAFDRILVSMWVSMIQEAVRLDIPIRVTFPEASSKISQIELVPPAP